MTVIIRSRSDSSKVGINYKTLDLAVKSRYLHMMMSVRSTFTKIGPLSSKKAGYRPGLAFEFLLLAYNIMPGIEQEVYGTLNISSLLELHTALWSLHSAEDTLHGWLSHDLNLLPRYVYGDCRQDFVIL